MVSMSVFQTEDAGSIPATRSRIYAKTAPSEGCFWLLIAGMLETAIFLTLYL